MRQSINDVFNTTLAAKGEQAATEQEMRDHTSFPSFMIALEDAKAELLSKGWWFNTTVYELVPDVHGLITKPDNVLVANPIPSSSNQVFIGNVLINNLSGEPIDRPTRVVCFIDLPIEHLPPSAYAVVKYTTAIMSAGNLLSSGDLQIYADRLRRAESTLFAENTRQTGANRLRSNPRIRNLYRSVR
jgi:hypothetical protein|nr:MAG TPA: tail tubular protein [Caudoviricetes sp.]